jgi:hypothetical protein
VQEIFGMTPSTSLSSCASSSSSPTFRERSHSSSGSSKGRLSGGTIRTHWPFLRNSQDWTVRYPQNLVALCVTTPKHHGRKLCTKIFIYPEFKGTYEVSRAALEVLYLVVELNFVVLYCVLYCVHVKSW